MAEKLIQKLADGLIIRRSTPDDADALAQFNKQVHSEDKMDEVSLVDWTLYLDQIWFLRLLWLDFYHSCSDMTVEKHREDKEIWA